MNKFRQGEESRVERWMRREGRLRTEVLNRKDNTNPTLTPNLPPIFSCPRIVLEDLRLTSPTHRRLYFVIPIIIGNFAPKGHICFGRIVAERLNGLFSAGRRAVLWKSLLCHETQWPASGNSNNIE